MYILFEGIDTSGKTTQIELLKPLYPNAIYTKEPGGTDIGKEFRNILLHKGLKSYIAELYLFLADRAEHYEQIIKPNSDKLIISDRGFISGIAYAITNHPNINIEFLIKLNRYALSNQLPDLIILFETNKELILERMSKKSEDSIEKRGIDYLLRVQSNMKKILNLLNIKYEIINSSLDIQTIHQQIRGLI